MFDIDISPLLLLDLPAAAERNVRILVKRDDLLQPTGDIYLCGNKARKLKYNLAAAHDQGLHRLLTFGGAYSNHIAAVATAGYHLGWETIGLIRGEERLPLNPTLRHAKHCGMKLHYLDRATYRQRSSPELIAELKATYDPCYFLPEGGTNELAIKGCESLVEELVHQLGYLPDYICAACGTGGMLAGIIGGCNGRGRVIGVSALRGSFMADAVAELLEGNTPYTNWSVETRYHFGGYARFPQELRQFTQAFKQAHGILLDPVYTSKLFYGVFDLLHQDHFPAGTTVVVVHSGGIQGWGGFLPPPPLRV